MGGLGGSFVMWAYLSTTKEALLKRSLELVSSSLTALARLIIVRAVPRLHTSMLDP